ncbi:type III secretion system chaperone [Bordetella genomosp. 13]|uniref:type III secretion system chaperone n=1 Tax=Bordetella genomosp. 13 TaxID=463040 RepID=UPI0021B6894F|nr:type III secretion system chaperone [Bordetella genomosp. 13]
MPDPTFARIVSEFGHALGMPGLAPTSAELCQLVFDGRHVVQLIHMGARGQVLLSCVLPEAGNAQGCADLMAKANFMQAGRGAVVCRCPDGKVHMQLALPLPECSAVGLLGAVESLLNQADAWTERLAREPAAPAPSSFNPAMFLPV